MKQIVTFHPGIHDRLIESERLSTNHHPSPYSEMLLIGPKDRELLLQKNKTNPFRLTHHPRILGSFDIPSKKREIMNAIVDIVCLFSDDEGKIERVLSSGFVVSPPSCPFIFFFTSQRNRLDFFDKNSKKNLHFESMYALVEPQRCQRPVIGIGKLTDHKYSQCEIVDIGRLTDQFSIESSDMLESNPQSDWMLLKIDNTEENCLSDDCYFIPSMAPLKIPLTVEDENSYNICLISLPSDISESEGENISEMTKDEIASCFELNVKSLSYGNLIESKEGVIYYNAGSFNGSSGGAVTKCSQHFEEWSVFKQNVSLSRLVYGIHLGVSKIEENYWNRCCSVVNWFQSFLKHVYDPYKHCFDEDSKAVIENNIVLNNLCN